jgi:solute carrier family 25 (mitochondrial phosphate transporter), member 23/24/25/41
MVASTIKKERATHPVNIILGGIAGSVSRTATAPLELYKMQRQNPYIKHTTLREVIQYEGVRGLWKGNLVNIYRIFPQMSINYYIYNYVKSMKSVQIYSKENPSKAHLFSGTIGGIISTICVYPLDTVRSRLSLQTNNQYYDGIFDTFRKMTTRELYSGLSVGLMGFVPFNALNFVFYNLVKNKLTRCENSAFSSTNILTHLLSGGLAGVLSVTITYPTDVIRRRLHLQGFDDVVPVFNNTRECIRHIFFTEGFSGFYSGLFACYLKLFPAVGIQFSIMEYLKKTYNI